MNTSKKKIVTNILFLSGSQGLGWLLASFYVFIIPRYLGPANLGILSWITAVSSIIVVVANFGTTIFILRAYAQNPQQAQEFIGPAVLLNLGVGLVSWGLGILIISQLNQPEIVMVIFCLTGLASILYLSINPLRAALQGMDKMHFSFFETLIFRGTSTILIVAVVAFNLGFKMVTVSGLISTIILILVYWWWFLKYSNTQFKISLQIYKTLIKGGMSFLLIDISYNIYLYLDSLLLASLTNSKIVGYYSVPTRLLGSLLTAPVLIGQALLPTLSRMEKNDSNSSRDISRNTLTWMVCLSLPMALGCTVIAEPFIRFFYTDEFAPSIPVLIILGWTAVPMYLGIGLYQILISHDKQGSWSKLMIIAVFLNLGLNLGLIHFFQQSTNNGATGAALSLLITEIVVDIFGIRLVSREIVNSRLFVNALKSLGASLIMSLVIWPLRDLWIIVPVFVGVLVYGVIVVFAFNLGGTVVLYYHKLRERLPRPAGQPANPVPEPPLGLPDTIVEAQSKI